MRISVVAVSIGLAAVLALASGPAGAAPTANNQSLGKLGPGKEVLFSLSYGGSPTSFTIVSNPAHGTLQSYNSRAGTSAYPQYYYYKANTGYDGADSFTWKCADASGDSNVATCSVTISATPTANNQTAMVVTGGEVLTSLSYSDPVGDKTCTFTILAGPAHGTVQSYNERNGVTYYPHYYYYKATAGYTGADAFTWKVNNGYADSAVATVSITVNANTAPVANNYSSTVSSSTRGSVYLSVAHSDSGQTLTYTLVSGPSHGTVEMPAPTTANGTYAYYTSAKDYVGGDSLTWKVSDGMAESGVATATITVNAILPVPQNQTAAARKDAATDIAAAYTGGGGYSYSAVKVSNPSHGTVVVTNGTTFRYTPASGYLGGDSFTWAMIYNGTGTTATVTCSLLVKADTGNDWPQWRCDEYRSAATLQSLPASLYLQWRRDYPAPARAWSSSYFNFDQSYEPVVVGKRLFVPSNKGDFIEALSTDTGAVLWRFYAEGPVRCAPVAFSNKVAFGSDDGFVYCLNAADGSVAWKFQAGPSARRVTGNGRMISVWPVRGGLMLMNGKLHFAAGVWPLEGIFAYCVDAESGAEIWRNDSLGGIYDGQPHDGACVPGGPPPQGYLTASLADSAIFYLPASRSIPAQLSMATGGLSYWWANWAPIHGQDVNNSGKSVDVGWFIDAWTGKGRTTVSVGLTAGARTCTATDASALGVSGTAGSMLAGDGKLFVVTTAGSVYCFGGTQVSSPPVYTVTTTPLPNTSDSWTTTVQSMLSRVDLKEGMALVLGVGTGRLAEELAKQTTNLKIVLVDTNAATIASLRSEMDAAGLHGSRVMGIVADPMTCRFPPMGAGIIASEDSAVAGYLSGQAFVEKLYGWTRPFGGEIWLPTTDSQHTAIQGWVSGSTNMPLSLVLRNGAFTQIKRTGMTAEQATLKAPIGVLWYGDVWTQNPGVSAGQIGSSKDLYTGLAMTATTEPGTAPTMPGVMSTQRNNPLNGEKETRQVVMGYGCGSGAHALSWNVIGRRAGSHAINDTSTESGTIHIPGVRPVCSQASDGTIANGVLYEYSPGCSCAYTLTSSSSAWVSTPDAEQDNWAFWGTKRVQGLMEDKPIRNLGVNFGAPSQRMAEDGVLWLEHPSGNYSLITAPVYYRGSTTFKFHHSSRIQGQSNRKWVFGSNVGGATNIQVGLMWPVVALPTAAAPVIDGSLNDSCWDGRAKVSMPRDRNTAFSLRYDSTNLYIGCQNGGAANYIQWTVNLSDRIRVSQGAAVSMGYYYASDTGFIKQSSGIDSSAWAAACTVTNGFVVEMIVPWASLEALGYWKEQLVINVSPPWVGSVGDGYLPVFLDCPRGLAAQSRPYNVRLYFAETEGASAGQRVFDVRLQGNTVLSNFDIIQAAGGVNKGVIREFAGVGIQDFLNIDLVPKTGSPMISGVEILGTYVEDNQLPVAAIDADVTSGASPLTVKFTAHGSYDPDGQIAACNWDFGDDTSGSGYTVTHTFGAPGTYTVRLGVLDAQGGGATSSQTIVVGAGPSLDFTCRIRATGGDYTNLSSWAAAIGSDITAGSSMIFAVSGRGAYVPADDGAAVTFASGGGGVLKHINGDNMAYVVGCTGTVAAGQVTCASGHDFTVAGAGSQIRHAVAQCYNDWPTGLRDNVGLSAWSANDSHQMIIRAAAGHRHNGTMSLTAATGFTLRNAADADLLNIPYSVGRIRLQGLCLYNGCGSRYVMTASRAVDAKECIIRGGQCGMFGYQYGVSSLVNCIFYGQARAGIEFNMDSGGQNITIHNCTFAGSPCGVLRSRGENGSLVLLNCLVKATSGGISSVGSVIVNYTATSDGTATGWNSVGSGEGNRANQTFAFVNEAGGDFHLAATDNGARDHGSSASMAITDIDGEVRTGVYDIGADEAPEVGIDAYGIPNSWKIQYFGSATAPGSGALEDPDHDGMSNLQEYVAGTNPRDAGSRFQCSVFGVQGGEFLLRFLTETGRVYGVLGRGEMTGTDPWAIVTNGMPGTGGYVEVRDPLTGAKKFYRVTVRMP